MSSIEKNAVKFAKEMIEHGYLASMTVDDVVNTACDMAYKIHEKTKKPIDVKREIHEAVQKHVAKPDPQQY